MGSFLGEKKKKMRKKEIKSGAYLDQLLSVFFLRLERWDRRL